jgi:hypothetical protein
VDNVDRYKDRIPNYPLVKIAQLIVDEVYFSAQKLFREGKLTDENYFKLRGYYVYVNMDDHKIYNCSKNQFDLAVRKFLNINPSYLREQMLIGDTDGRKLSRQEALKAVMKKFSEYFGG